MAKKYHTEEERKAAARAKSARYLSNPENKAKVHARQAARRADPEVRAKQRAYNAEPENVAKRREYMRAKRTDEAFKQKEREDAKAYRSTPEYRQKRRESVARYQAKPENKAKLRASRKAYGKTTAGIRTHLKSSWRTGGIKFASEFDRELWLALALYDGTVCAVTGMTNAEHQAKFGKRLVLDHDHSTGEPRRFLCDHINVSLGRLERLSLTDEQLNNLISLVKEDRRQAER